MIEKISVKNFKNHADTQIELGRVTALVGPNGCGKTSILQATHLSIQFADKLGENIFNAALHPLQVVRYRNIRFNISLSGNIKAEKWKISLMYDPSNSLRSITNTDITVEYQLGNQPPIYRVKTPEGPVLKQFLGESSHEINRLMRQTNEMAFDNIIEETRTAYFKAIAQSISLPSHTLDIPPTIGIDGNDVASVISYLKNSKEETHKLIEDDLKAIVPIIKRVRVHPVPKIIKEKRTISANGNTIAYDEDRQVIAQELIFDTQSGDGLPASLVSEGTLIILALLTLLHTSDASLFLLDDIDQALHPLAQMKLMQTLKDFAEKFDRQIIITSHSPYIIDALKPEDVWVMATDDQGISRCKRLSDHPDIENARDVLTTGEIWSAEGEEWVFAKPAQAEAVNA